MSRTAKVVDATIFQRLRDFAIARGQTSLSADVRWLRGDANDENFVANTPVQRAVRFSRHRSLVVLESDGRTHLGLLGFDFEVWPLAGREIEADELASGELSLLLYESGVAPVAQGSQVVDIVGAGSRADPGYQGHEPAQIAALFPRARLLDLDAALTERDVWPSVLRVCVQECEEGASWIEAPLASELRDLADLALADLPYESICRSIFDLDPRSLFLAIYRLIEAAYAYGASSRVAAELAVGKPWHEVAEVLDRLLGWHPRHGDALHELLREAAVPAAELKAVCREARVSTSGDLPASAGKAIRDLRNRIVHYGPSMSAVKIEEYDWNALCVALLRVLRHVFKHAFSSAPQVPTTLAPSPEMPNNPNRADRWWNRFKGWLGSARVGINSARQEPRL